MTRKQMSPSLHEAMVARHAKLDEPDPVLDALHEAMQAGRVAAERAQRIAAAHMRNEMTTVPARHRRTKQDAWRVVRARRSAWTPLCAGRGQR